MSHPPAFDQARQNRSTAHQWPLFASHREAIEKLIASDGARGLTLCVLGAGNCNDLDLPHLARVYERIHLVDLDRDALSGALARQRVEGEARIHLHAPVDLTGLGDLAARWTVSRAGNEEIEEAIGRLAALPMPSLPKTDVVLSPCLLSQLINPFRQSLGRYHPRYPAMRDTMLARHFRLMTGMLDAGGRGVVVIDLASSEAVPELPQVRQEDLADLMDSIIRRNQCFSGLQPSRLLPILRCIADMTNICQSRPWLWHLGLRRSFLVYALVFDRR